MSKAFDSIKRSLLQAIEHAEGHVPQTRMFNPPQSHIQYKLNICIINEMPDALNVYRKRNKIL